MTIEQEARDRLDKALKGMPPLEAAKLQALMGNSRSDPVGALKSLHRMLGDLIDRLEKKQGEKK